MIGDKGIGFGSFVVCIVMMGNLNESRFWWMWRICWSWNFFGFCVWLCGLGYWVWFGWVLLGYGYLLWFFVVYGVIWWWCCCCWIFVREKWFLFYWCLYFLGVFWWMVVCFLCWWCVLDRLFCFGSGGFNLMFRVLFFCFWWWG